MLVQYHIHPLPLTNSTFSWQTEMNVTKVILILISSESIRYLSAKLFRGELESGGDLLGEDFGITEAK